MIPPQAATRSAIHAGHIRAFRLKPILMTAIAASRSSQPENRIQAARNCLKPKEIRRTAQAWRCFDLRQSLNYLKVKITGGKPDKCEIGDAALCTARKAASRYDCIMILDSETKAVELPEDHGNELRLWLRLLTCTTLIEGEVRSRLREWFDVTLPRFDLMAQLDKVPEGMTLSDVSKRMMVSNGNVTGLVERLVESGHLDRRTSDTDRRVQVIRLTKIGRAEFRKMAAEHEIWIADLFADLAPKDVRELMRLLAKTKASAQKSAKRRAL
jgi:DNA-binding MarR family transcriptional regulator